MSKVNLNFPWVVLGIGVCLRLVVAGPPNVLKTCFEGYTLGRGGQCVQEVSEDPRLTCSVGVLDGKGCKVQLPKVKRCSEGYTLDANGGCSYLVPSDIQYFCPAAYTDNGDACIKSEPGELVSYCDAPAERINNQCILLKRTQPLIKLHCPSDAQLEDGRCWKIAETFDCSQECKFKSGPFACEKKNKQTSSGGGFVPRQVEETSTVARGLGGEEKSTENDPDSLPSSPVLDLIPASPPRHYQTILVAQTCAKRYEIPPITQQSCPPEYHLDSRGCFIQEVYPPKTKCAANDGPVESCPRRVVTAEKVARCTNGKPAIKGKCFEVVQGDIVEYCPNGYLENSLGLCEGYVEANTQCASDLTFRGGKCMGRRTRQPIVVEDTTVVLNTTRANIKELKELFQLKPKL